MNFIMKILQVSLSATSIYIIKPIFSHIIFSLFSFSYSHFLTIHFAAPTFFSFDTIVFQIFVPSSYSCAFVYLSLSSPYLPGSVLLFYPPSSCFTALSPSWPIDQRATFVVAVFVERSFCSLRQHAPLPALHLITHPFSFSNSDPLAQKEGRER